MDRLARPGHQRSAWDWIGDTTGINDNYIVSGGAGSDGMYVQDATVTFCGWPIGVPSLAGRSLQLLGNGGNDMLWSPTTLNTDIFGGAGDDWINSGRASAFLYGEDGDDLIFNER